MSSFESLGPGLMPCGCSNEDCPIIVCVTCRCSDCKWPGECKGRCAECGEPLPEQDPKSPPSMHCSEACGKAYWDRGIADGTIIAVSDLTPEQLNEMFNQVGLALEGVGERKPS